MFKYVMKAAAKSEAQLLNRISSFNKLQLKPSIELYLSGSDDIFKSDNSPIIKNCLKFPECEYIVHFPIFDIATKYIYDAYNSEYEKLCILLDFCKKINSKALIMHRCFGFNREIDKTQAEDKFLEKAVKWNQMAKESDIKILIENYGFAWLPDGFGVEYITSPLDHFFPWDIIEFHKNITRLNLDNIGILLDIAHAVLSSNMFNMIQRYPELRNDRRFKNICDDDLKKNNSLRVEEFIIDIINYFHISDSLIWTEEDGISSVKKFLYTENLPIGNGNINYSEIFKDIPGNKVMIMEINSENGDHINNISQLKAVEFFRSHYN